MSGLNADSILASLNKDLQDLGQGGAQALLSKAQSVINGKAATASAALSSAPAADKSSAATKAGIAQTTSSNMGVFIGASVLLAAFVAWKVLKKISGGG